MRIQGDKVSAAYILLSFTFSLNCHPSPALFFTCSYTCICMCRGSSFGTLFESYAKFQQRVQAAVFTLQPPLPPSPSIASAFSSMSSPPNNTHTQETRAANLVHPVKPMLISEFGVDALNFNIANGVPDDDQQSSALLALWRELQLHILSPSSFPLINTSRISNRVRPYGNDDGHSNDIGTGTGEPTVCLGGIIFEFCDEWWKGSTSVANKPVLEGCPEADLSVNEYIYAYAILERTYNIVFTPMYFRSNVHPSDKSVAYIEHMPMLPYTYMHSLYTQNICARLQTNHIHIRTDSFAMRSN